MLLKVQHNGVGNYNLFDTQTEGLHLLRHQEWTPSILRLDLELSSDQYRTLVDQYGDMKSVTMETIDLDQDGAMDKVAVMYVGSESEWIEELKYHDSASLRSYIEKHIEPSWYPHLSLN